MKTPNQSSFYTLWQWLRFIAFIIVIVWFIFFSIKAHSHVIDIEIDLHGYIERLRKEVDQERDNQEVILQEMLSKNIKEKDKKERE